MSDFDITQKAIAFKDVWSLLGSPDLEKFRCYTQKAIFKGEWRYIRPEDIMCEPVRFRKKMLVPRFLVPLERVIAWGFQPRPIWLRAGHVAALRAQSWAEIGVLVQDLKEEELGRKTFTLLHVYVPKKEFRE